MQRWLVWWLIGLCTACIAPKSHVCANGNSCPSDTVCTPSRHLCARPEQIDACAALAADAACTYASTRGFCIDGACLPQVCGDGVIEPGEACDDTNTLASDRCSSDCLSLWSRVDLGNANHLASIWGSGPSDVFAVGTNGTIVHYDGAAWTGLM